MIKLKNINIKFEREIIKDGELLIPDSAITVIAGESGSGKTSLLYMLGLISSNENYEYLLDDELIDLNDKITTSRLQRELLGIMFQDNSLIDSLTIGENIKMMANLSGRNIEEQEIIDLLAEVELTEEILHLYPSKLSGGELQRASLAAMLAKRPKYIFMDEPTSALDSINAQKVMNIIKKLAEKGCAIVVATHSQEIFELANKIYFIQDKQILLKKDCLNSRESLKVKKRKENFFFGFKELYSYANSVKRKAKGLNMLLVAFCAVAITGFVVTNSVVTYLTDTQQHLLNQLSDREIFLVNQMSSTASEIKDYDGNLAINQEEYSRMENMEGVDKIYSLIELKSFSINEDEMITDNSIIVTTDSEEYMKNFSLDNSDLPSYFVVLPYFPEQQYDKQLCKVYDSDEQIYISYELAEELNLIECETDSVVLDYEIAVPIKKYVDVASENGEESIANLDVSIMQEMNVSVAGVLNPNVSNRYTINGNRVVYVPYDELLNFVNDVKRVSDERILQKYAGYEVIEWMPSACIIYANSYKNINVLEGKLENINSHFATRYDYQDTETIDKITQNISFVTKVILCVILIIIFVLMAMIFINSTVSRKREYAILKANGMTEAWISGLTVIESITQGLKIVSGALLLSIIVSVSLEMILLREVNLISMNSVIGIFIFVILFVTIPSIFSVLYVSNIKVDRILRN